jgi:transposase InsO family protein
LRVNVHGDAVAVWALDSPFSRTIGPATIAVSPYLGRPDEWLLEEIRRVHRENYECYGSRRGVEGAAARGGDLVARCTVERLMSSNGIQGAKRRGKPWRTTTPDPAAKHVPDLVERDFTAQAPDRLWVADFTYLRSWEGVVFFAFVIDVFSRMVVGWQFATHMRDTPRIPQEGSEAVVGGSRRYGARAGALGRESGGAPRDREGRGRVQAQLSSAPASLHTSLVGEREVPDQPQLHHCVGGGRGRRVRRGLTVVSLPPSARDTTLLGDDQARAHRARHRLAVFLAPRVLRSRLSVRSTNAVSLVPDIWGGDRDVCVLELVSRTEGEHIA